MNSDTQGEFGIYQYVPKIECSLPHTYMHADSAISTIDESTNQTVSTTFCYVHNRP